MGKSWRSGARTHTRSSFTHSYMKLLALPLEIWEIVFDLLPALDLQIISKVESLSSPPEILAYSFTLPLVISRFLDYVSSSQSHEDSRTGSRFTELDWSTPHGQDLAH